MVSSDMEKIPLWSFLYAKATYHVGRILTWIRGVSGIEIEDFDLLHFAESLEERDALVSLSVAESRANRCYLFALSLVNDTSQLRTDAQIALGAAKMRTISKVGSQQVIGNSELSSPWIKLVS